MSARHLRATACAQGAVAAARAQPSQWRNASSARSGCRAGARAALSGCGALVLLGALLVLTVPGLPAVIIGCALQALGTAGLTSIAMSLTDSPRSMGFVTASIAASSGQGVFAVRSTESVPDEERPAAIGLFNLCYLLGAAFGPATVSLLQECRLPRRPSRQRLNKPVPGL
ncbi:hypothetical protein ABZ154_27485 [Streptomyces sp. NPDC006261]|uniref:hypothetical protein n=1 Tax=Streptomyces sp. NPDC006261 TaxID=3156739 RepID=UPI0033A0E7EA